MSFTYGYLCAGTVFDLSYGMFQLGGASLMLYVMLLILLFLQLRCLFGTDGVVASVSVDGSYRVLHAADTFSICLSLHLVPWHDIGPARPGASKGTS